MIFSCSREIIDIFPCLEQNSNTDSETVHSKPTVCFQKKEPVGDDETIPEEIKANIDELSQDKLKVWQLRKVLKHWYSVACCV